MAESAEGVLFHKKFADEVQKGMQNFPKPHLVHILNDKWAALFIAGYRYDLPDIQTKLLELSRTVPLIYFLDAEDYGWMYKVYQKGNVVASIEVNYELPDEYGVAPDYQDRVAKQYEHRNPEAFRHFEIEDTIIRQLEQVVSMEDFINSEYVHDAHQVGQFMNLLGINEMWAMTYEWLASQRKGNT